MLTKVLWLWIIIWRVHCTDQIAILMNHTVNQEGNPEGMELAEVHLPKVDARIWEYLSKAEQGAFGMLKKNWISSTKPMNGQVASSPKSKVYKFFRIRFVSIFFMIAYIYSLINPILLLPIVAVFEPQNPIKEFGWENPYSIRVEDMFQEACAFVTTFCSIGLCLNHPCPYAQGNIISLWVLDWVWIFVFLFYTSGCFKFPGKFSNGAMWFILRNLIVLVLDYFRLGYWMIFPAISSVFELLYFVAFFLGLTKQETNITFSKNKIV